MIRSYEPFVYLIGWSDLDTYYIGSRFAPTAHPIQLWTEYFTSSKVVASYRKRVGEPDILVILKCFRSAADAFNHEMKLLRRLGVVGSDRFLNQAVANEKFRRCGAHSEQTKAKIRAKRAQQTFSVETRAKISAALRTRVRSPESRHKTSVANSRRIVSAETKQKISASLTGKSPSMATRQKMSLSHTGMLHTEASKIKMRELAKQRVAAG
jgi:hypothetical protein